jgi:putative transposase
MTKFIDEHRGRFGVEPICRVLGGTEAGFISVSGYYARRSRQPSRRQLRDEVLKPQILRIFKDNFDVYGTRKMWKALQREGTDVGRDQVARLMSELNIRGAQRTRRRRTTVPDETAPRPTDLVERHFDAPRPNRLWVADFTYVSTWAGFVYVAFVIDAYSRMIVGWKASTAMRTDLALDALEMALYFRSTDLEGLVHHSDRGSQYLAIRYSDRLAEAGVIASVGSKGDSYDNALAETINGLYKTELVFNKGPWPNVDKLEIATATWVHWFNNTRLHSACGYLPPVEYEAVYYSQNTAA